MLVGGMGVRILGDGVLVWKDYPCVSCFEGKGGIEVLFSRKNIILYISVSE